MYNLPTGRTRPLDLKSLPPDELLAACVAIKDGPVWTEFIRRSHPLISAVALRTARQWGEPVPCLIDDLTQETYLKLCADNCRLLNNFRSQYPGAIFGFLKVVTANVVHDHFKTSRAAKRGSGSFFTNLQDQDGNENCPVALGCATSSVEQAILLDEIDHYLVERVAPSELARSRRIFWLYYRCGLSARAIAALPNIELTTKGVESTILRLNRLVRKAITRAPEVKDSKDDYSDLGRKGVHRAGSL